MKSWTRLSNFTFTFHFHALEEEMATHSSVLAWRIPGTAGPGELPSTGLHRVGHDWSDTAAAAADYDLFVAKFRLKLKKVGKTTRPFRYDLNQLPYDYKMEVRNRFKGLDLVDRVPEEIWTGSITLYRRQWPKPFQRKRKAKRQSSLRMIHKSLRKEETQKARG